MIDFQSMPQEYRLSDKYASGFPIFRCDTLEKMAKTSKSASTQRERSPYGARLLDARKVAGLTQAELAKKAECPLSTIAEAETTGAGSTYTPQLAHALGVSALWLATGKGQREAAPVANERSSFASLSAYEAALITVIRDGLTDSELMTLTESVKIAVKTKNLRVSRDETVGEIGVYFAVDRRSHDVNVATDQRGAVPWEIRDGSGKLTNAEAASSGPKKRGQS